MNLLPHFVSSAVKFFLFFCCLHFLGGLFPAYGFGRAEDPEKEALNKEWILCVTAFDVSALSASRRVTGDVLIRNLVDSLEAVNRRTRPSGEAAYYEEAAWSRASSEAAAALAAKRGERDILLYRGNPNWKYRNEIKTVDAAILKLEEAYEKALATRPRISGDPLFTLTAGNKEGVFPAAPEEGGEYRFCTAQKADAFLQGTVVEFHDRLYVTLRLYTLYSRSYQYEDEIIFSSEDINLALAELSGRLASAVSGAPPAALAVTVNPADAMIQVGGSFAGRGSTGILERPPSDVTVEIFADNYEPVSIPLTLRSAELSDLSINLKPLALESFGIDAAGAGGASVYQGALYRGETPLTLAVKQGHYEYIKAESPGKRTAEIVFQGTSGSAGLQPSVGRDPEEGQVSRYRRFFYGAYGRFWIALPVAFLMSGMATAYVNAYNYQPTEGMYDTSRRNYYISIGAMVLAGCLLTETIYRVIRYVHVSGQDAPKVLKDKQVEE